MGKFRYPNTYTHNKMIYKMIETKIFKVKFHVVPTESESNNLFMVAWNTLYKEKYVYIAADNIAEAAELATKYYDKLVSKVEAESGYKFDGITSIEEHLSSVFSVPSPVVINAKVCRL